MSRLDKSDIQSNPPGVTCITNKLADTDFVSDYILQCDFFLFL